MPHTTCQTINEKLKFEWTGAQQLMTRRANVEEITAELRRNCARLNELIFAEELPGIGQVDDVVLNLRGALVALRENGLLEANVRVAFASAIMAELLSSF
jgi:hypothetical protein